MSRDWYGDPGPQCPHGNVAGQCRDCDQEQEWAVYSGDGDPLVPGLPSQESADNSLRTARGYGEAEPDAYVDRWWG